MKILIACEFSGVVRDAFLARGHDAISCDLLPTMSPGPHYQCDVREVLCLKWDMLIAHPPCTYLSNAAARYLYAGKKLNEERFRKGLLAKEFFMMLYNANVPKICIENPKPSRIFALPERSQIINPYEFGDDIQKQTHLWLKGLPPLLEKMQVVEKPASTRKSKWFNSGRYRDRKEMMKKRSIFFEGVANVMAEQWG